MFTLSLAVSSPVRTILTDAHNRTHPFFCQDKSYTHHTRSHATYPAGCAFTLFTGVYMQLDATRHREPQNIAARQRGTLGAAHH